MVTYFKEVIKRGILGADVFSKTSEQSTAVTRKCVENMWLLKDGSSHMVQINGNDCKAITQVKYKIPLFLVGFFVINNMQNKKVKFTQNTSEVLVCVS